MHKLPRTYKKMETKIIIFKISNCHQLMFCCHGNQLTDTRQIFLKSTIAKLYAY